MEIPADSRPQQSIYKLMIGSILPRPIGWISSMNEQGQPNLAPFSFFNAVGSNPPLVLFCPSVSTARQRKKDTFYNVKTTGEFVVNIVTESLVEAMNLTSGEYPSDVDEFAVAGLTAAPSVTVKPPRVAESPIHFECRVHQIVELGEDPGAGSVVIGRVLHVHVDDAILIGEDKIDLGKLQPIGRLAGSAYCRVTDIFEMARPDVSKGLGAKK